jgi:hypothetical protein
MENKTLRSNVFSDSAMENLQTLTDISTEFYSTLLNNMTGNNTLFRKNIGQLGKNALDPFKAIFNTGDCCPPKEECPPHCIESIFRRAMVGERIVVPFNVKNDCEKTKIYQVGIREMTDQDGNPASVQPKLNKSSVSLQPYASERVLVMLDLAKMEKATYTAEIVLRENEFNQNICLTVDVGDHATTTVTPYEEKKFKLKWQSWRSHFYCEPNNNRTKQG